ncbi:capsule biosynthesis protein CapA [Rhodobacteraceae bacterium 2CG4]|uniref:Capsule biosynthesis protein CapA n=1 Tax=Halovulum marinum TaxID=2662447 RepID=A0A6L5YUY9_9RHOB|nr:capsular biosynthesis protein [Halovulum marinum]MSU88101.1 capsule biosynthesis protein CapA [Halovulum marinum]
MSDRYFLFLQGPHGPFFGDLARQLRLAGTQVHRIGFNAGDQHYWPHRDAYTPFLRDVSEWEAVLSAFLDVNPVTDLVLYGDTRPVHAIARRVARLRGLSVHCFEEGYLRPYWVTYERDGVNGNSRLMNMQVSEMRAMLGCNPDKLPEAPAQWGSIYHHMWYGALYHWRILFANRRYRCFRPHRTISVKREWSLYIKRLALLPLHTLERRVETRKLKTSGANYHLVLLQLAHDSSFRDHSDFQHISDFIDLCCKGFARGAPPHHRLVFKTHPLEDGREPLFRLIMAAARRHGIAGRVQMIRGGRLGEMLDNASTAVTVNSTAGQQALWRGLPLRAFGRSVYDKPELVSHQPIDEFFANPRRPDLDAYMAYRQFLLQTSQFPGGFYTASGRADALRHVIDVMLADRDPYQSVAWRSESARPQLRTEAG